MMLRKRRGLRLLLCVPLCALILTLLPQTGAAAIPFSDLEGHWARETLERAYEEGLIAPSSDELMQPEAAMRKAEVLTALTRLIGAVPPGSLDGSEITAGGPYYDLARQATGLKLLPAEELTGLDKAVSREEAFTLIASAFQLSAPAQDVTILSQYRDAATLSWAARAPVAALLEEGYIHGYEGMLGPKLPITRGEFFTILERIVALQTATEDFDWATLNGGVSLPARQGGTGTAIVTRKGNAEVTLSELELHSNLLINADGRSLSLTDVSSDGRILLRNGQLNSLRMSGGSLSHLIIAAASGDVTFAPQNGAAVDTLTVGEGDGTLHLGDGIQKVEITGSGRTVYLDMTQLESLRVSGNGNQIVVAKSCHIDEATLLFAGEGNALTINGMADKLHVWGDGSRVDGSGSAGELLIHGIGCDVTLQAEERSELTDYGLGDAAITLTASHNPLPAGELLSVTAAFSEVTGSCALYACWYQDGVPSGAYQNPAFLLEEGAVSEFFPNVSYSEEMALTTVVGLELRYQRGDVSQRVYAEVEIALENYPYEYYHPPGPTAEDKLIALTFDDGPGAYTAQLLDTLAQREVKVTFFVIGGSANRNPDLLARMVAEGHEIGSHTYNHPNLTTISSAKIRSELDATSNAIEAATGIKPVLMRPPYGSFNKTVLSISGEKGLSVIHWSVDTQDWLSRKSSSILQKIFNNGAASARDGDIILMHDIVPASVEVAGTVVDRLLADGYQFVTVSELLSLRYADGAQPGSVYFYGR